MFSEYKPTWVIDAIYKITLAQLKKLGTEAVLTDLDNMLITWNNPDGTKELKTWSLEMKSAEITVLVASNNKNSQIKHAVGKFDLDYVARALKPAARGFKLAEKELDLKSPEMSMVGDQIMTDIRGVNTVGIRGVLIQPIVSADNWNTRISRFSERKIMKCLSKEYPKMT